MAPPGGRPDPADCGAGRRTAWELDRLIAFVSAENYAAQALIHAVFPPCTSRRDGATALMTCHMRYDPARLDDLAAREGETMSQPESVAVVMNANSVRGRLNAVFFCVVDGYVHRLLGDRTAALFADLPDDIVELGPGTGTNLRY